MPDYKVNMQPTIQPHTHPTLEGKTITTNTINPVAKAGSPVEPPKSSLAITAAFLLLLGFAVIVVGLFITSIPLFVLGGAIILSANAVAVLSLRELS